MNNGKHPPAAASPRLPEDEKEPHDPKREPLPDSKPVTLAARFLKHHQWGTPVVRPDEIHPDNPDFARVIGAKPTKLRHWREEFYLFTGSGYERVIPEVIKSHVNTFLNAQRVFKKGGEVVDLVVNRKVLGDTLDQLRLLCQTLVESLPAWLDAEDRPDPKDVLAFPNGLLDLCEYLHDPTVALIPPTSDWFSETVSPYFYDPSAGCPVWLDFLFRSLGDADLIASLQEWFGYCLTSDTSLQKMLWLHGVGGAGKGTIMRQLARVVGERNCVSFDLWSLGDRFILSSFQGKRVAMSGEAVLGNDTDSRKIMGRINGITGEDPQQVDRKNRDLIASLRLTTRIVVSINAFPSLPESGNAMGRRALLIPFERSFADAPDTTLEARLAGETAGITNWALEGLCRLRRQGRFTESTAGKNLKERFVRVMSPMKGFVEECVDEVPYNPDAIGGREGVETTNLTYTTYRLWCRDNGHSPSAKCRFGEMLRDVCPTVERVRQRDTTDNRIRFWEYRGIQLNPAWKTRAEAAQ